MIFEKLLLKFKIPFFILIAFILISWGRSGHRVVSLKSSLSFNSEMEQFHNWTDYIASHAADPDFRRSSDKSEAPKHYIDIDNYPEFNESGKISHSYSEVVDLHGKDFIISQGILPWTTITTYDSLISCFSRGDWKKAVFFAADLGHYVADGHMPLHLTRNYDGQFTGNKGIHGRYESQMINKYENAIFYNGKPAVYIDDPEEYIFNYIYKNYKLLDSILIADNRAKQVSEDTGSDEYTDAMWSITKGFTHELFSESSHAIASLIYTAWVNAGSPKIKDPEVVTANKIDDEILNISKSGFLSRSVNINYNIEKDSLIKISVYDYSGKYIETLVDTANVQGPGTIKWKSKNGRGKYFVVLKTKNLFKVKEAVIGM